MLADRACASAHHWHYHRPRENARTEPRSLERELPAVSAARRGEAEVRIAAHAQVRDGRGAAALLTISQALPAAMRQWIVRSRQNNPDSGRTTPTSPQSPFNTNDNESGLYSGEVSFSPS